MDPHPVDWGRLLERFQELPIKIRDRIIHQMDPPPVIWQRFMDRFFLERIQELPVELSSMILDMLSPKPFDLISPEKRMGLSEESFASIQPLPPSDLNSLSTLRLLCPVRSRFAELVLSHQFVRVATRFELGKNEDLENGNYLKGFSRLRAIASDPAIAKHVKQFSYMIPRFFTHPQGNTDFQRILGSVKETTETIQAHLDRLSLDDRQRPQVQKRLRHSQEREALVKTIMERAEDQRRILKEQIDVKCLSYAFKQFTNLLQIRLMPLNDRFDVAWERFLESHDILGADLRPSLPDAFRHSAQTLTSVLRKSGNNASRFSSRAMDLGTTVPPTTAMRTTISDIAKRLTHLDLQLVHGDGNIDDKIRLLTNLFLLVFKAAIELKSLHVGFGRRVSIPLEVVFHDIHFKNLRHLGIHEWHVHVQELIELLERHKNSLTSLRLRHVSLKEESSDVDGMWMNVLEFIRLNLKLKWISLRGIGYSEDSHTLGGMRFGVGGIRFGNMIYGQPPTDDESDGSSDQNESDPGDGIGYWSESNGEEGEDLDDEEHSTANHSDATAIGEQQEEGPGDSADESNDDQEDHMSDLDEIHNLSISEIHDIDGPAQETGESTLQEPAERGFTSGSPCYCHEGYSWTDLRDNGITVTKSQWKKWEKWAVRRCQTHDPMPEAAT